MTLLNWNEIQTKISTSGGLLFVSPIVTYIKNNLTEEQLKPLGDIESGVTRIIQSNPKDIKAVIDALIGHAKNGVING